MKKWQMILSLIVLICAGIFLALRVRTEDQRIEMETAKQTVTVPSADKRLSDHAEKSTEIYASSASSKNDEMPEAAEKKPETAGQKNDALQADSRPSGNASKPIVPPIEGIINILIVGVDNDSSKAMDETGNSDGLVLMTINADTKQIVMTSFMRDTKVKVNDYRRDKLTYVYHEDGLEKLIEVMENNFEISIDYYALFNYLDVIDIVDAVGGVEIDLAEEELATLSSKIKSITWLKGVPYEDYKLTEEDVGRITVNGIQAASYMRIRPVYGHYDAGRTERIRDIIACIIDKMYGKSTTELLQFADTLLKNIKTDIPEELMLLLAANKEQLKSFERFSDRIPLDGAYVSQNDPNGYYAEPDFEINNRHLQESLYGGKH